MNSRLPFQFLIFLLIVQSVYVSFGVNLLSYISVCFMVVNDKIDRNLHVFYTFMRYLVSSIMSRLCDLPASFFKLLQISKKPSNMFIENHLRGSGPA